jgi:rubredoxin
MADLRCPRCRAEQAADRQVLPISELEGRDWLCPGCRANLMVLDGRLSVVEVLPPMGSGERGPESSD